MTIHVAPLEHDRFHVEVSDARTATEHVVDASGANEVVRANSSIPLERLVRLSFEFLLERESAAAILSTFALDDIGKYFPEYSREIARRAEAT